MPSLKAQLSKYMPANDFCSISYWNKDVADYVDLDETLFEDGAAAGVITIKVNIKVFIYLLVFT